MNMKKEDSRVDTESIEDLQSELLRLKRQFCLLEDDRRAYKQETKHELRIQKETIHSLNLEYDELAKEYKLAGSLQNHKVDNSDTEVLVQLLHDEESSLQAIAEKLKQTEKVDIQIRAMLKRIDIQRKEMGGVSESGRRCKETIKRKRVMEDRLNAANVKFNTALFENGRMRSEIDHIIQQKKKCADFNKKLKYKFKQGKAEKDFLIEKATNLFNGRDEAHHRMQSLRERSERDMATFNSDLKDIIRVIDHDKKLREFMNTKMEERNELFEAAVAKRKDKKLYDLIQGLQTQVESYESIFKELKDVSGIDDIDEMVSRFIKVEDENFASFNFVKEQNTEIQLGESIIKDLKEKIEAMGKEEVRISKQHKEIMSELQKTDAMRQKESQSVVNQLKMEQKLSEKICSLFGKMMDDLQCDRRALTELLGGSKITCENLSAYLGLIEQRANELLQAESFVSHKHNGEQTKQLVAPKNISFQTVGYIARVCILPPSILADISESNAGIADEFVRPMSQAEVRVAAMQGNATLSK